MEPKWLPLNPPCRHRHPSTSARTSTTSSTRALAIVELLEQILSSLPASSIIRCRRVCRKFHSTIASSKVLRRRLFLEAAEPCSDRAVNPLPPAWFHQQRSGYRDSTIAARIDILALWEGAAVGSSSSTSSAGGGGDGGGGDGSGGGAAEEPQQQQQQQQQLHHRRRPLWDSMFVSQPPSTTCVIPVGSHTTIFFRRDYPSGMTFGDLERAVIAAYQIRKGRRCNRERLKELSAANSVLIYWE